MAAPKIYKSTDANAPVLNGIYGSGINVIRAVCVTGYGDKAPLGWSEEFSKNGAIAIRPGVEADGNRLFYRFEDDNSIVYSSSHAKFRVSTYESMSDIDTGAGVISEKHWYKSNVANITAMPWMIIGDAFGFHFIVNYTQTAPYSAYAEVNFAGHGNPFFSDDAWFSMITGLSSTTLNVLSLLPFIYSPEINSYANSIYLSRKLTGDAATIGAASGLKYNGGIGGVGGGFVAGSSYSIPSEFNYPYKGELMTSIPVVADGGQYGMRGTLPGLAVPQHGGGFTDRMPITIGNDIFIPIKIAANTISSNAYYGWILINIGENFRP